jgi:hypothetical protein
MFDGHPLALTGWLEADQAELTVLHRPEDDGALRATAYRFSSLVGEPGAHGHFRVRPRLKACRAFLVPPMTRRRLGVGAQALWIARLLTPLARAKARV